MKLRHATMIVLVAVMMASVLPCQADKPTKKSDADPAERLVGRWELFMTKQPGKPYERGYKGRPFQFQGQDAFALVMDFKKDGTVTRVMRTGSKGTRQKGTWSLDGKELRQSWEGSSQEEVIYLRFEGPDEYTIVEVYEETPDPGLFARFRRLR